MEQKILAYLKEHETEIFEDLKSLVLTEASTSDIEALAKVREKLVMLIKERTGEDSFVYEAENGHCPVRFQYGKGTEKILFIGHYDTVHLIGALKYYTEGNELHGPGVYDMKGGLISAIWTVKAYKDLGIDPGKRLEFIFNGDEGGACLRAVYSERRFKDRKKRPCPFYRKDSRKGIPCGKCP